MDEYYEAVSALPPWLAGPLSRVPQTLAPSIQEVRLRSGCRVGLTVSGKPILAESFCPELRMLTGVHLHPEQMDELLFSLCGQSVHACEEQLKKGFLTLPGGHRVGVGGRYTIGPDGKPALQKAESFDLRVARFLLCTLPQELSQRLDAPFTGLLLAGEPGSGKTTLLRSILPALQQKGHVAAVADERGEILPASARHLGCFSGCDSIAGLPKETAVEMALRSLGPDVLLLDELGSMEETRLLEQGFFSGVGFIATIHAGSLAEAEQRPQVRFLREHGMLNALFVLAGRQTPGCIKEAKSYC